MGDYQNAIEINGLTKRYDGFTLDNVSFCVPVGSIMGFIGQNGAGKSTTIKAILNIIGVDVGKIKLLILDEATTGLDPVVRNEILDIFRDYLQDETNSILMSSHITSDLEKIADCVTFIDKGKILLTGVKDEIPEKHGVIKCRKEELSEIAKEDFISARISDFGAEAMPAAKSTLPC